MGSTTNIFSGNAAIPHVAFNLRDDYYREMARFVVNAAQGRIGKRNLGNVAEIGAGIGISTMEILKDAEHVFAVEPDAGMRYMLELNVMGNPAVFAVEGNAENLMSALCSVDHLWDGSVLGHIFLEVDAVLCSQVFHLFNPPNKESLVPKVLEQVSRVLCKGGVFAFDLSQSNYKFALHIADHRSSSSPQPGQIVTELAHPLYGEFHAILYGIVKRKYPDFNRENLWPSPTARMGFSFLSDSCEIAGLRNLRVSEELYPVNGKRVIEFIRNGWTVFFRWPPLSYLPSEKKLALMNEGMHELFHGPNFEQMLNVMSYHPTAVFTAVKG